MLLWVWIPKIAFLHGRLRLKPKKS